MCVCDPNSLSNTKTFGDICKRCRKDENSAKLNNICKTNLPVTQPSDCQTPVVPHSGLVFEQERLLP